MTASRRRGQILVILGLLLLVPLAVCYVVFGLQVAESHGGSAGLFLRLKSWALGLFGVPLLAWGIWQGYPWARSTVVFFCGAVAVVLAGFAILLFVGWGLLDGEVAFGLGLASLFAAPAVLYGTMAYVVAVSPSVQAFLEHRRGCY